MDDTRLRAVIREEIALAVKTLGEVALSNARAMVDDRTGEQDGGFAINSAATFFESAYEADCAVADEQRAQDAENPFEETASDTAVDPAVQTLVKAEVLDALRELRSTFYMSGHRDDYRIAERLDGIITARERAADE